MRSDDLHATPQLRVQLRRTALIAVVLVLLLAAALAVDKFPGRERTHARHTSHHARIASRPRHAAPHHVVGNCRIRYRHHNADVIGMRAHSPPVGSCRIRYRHHNRNSIALAPRSALTPKSRPAARAPNARVHGPETVTTGASTTQRNAHRTALSHTSKIALIPAGAPKRAPPSLPGEQRAYLTLFVNGTNEGEVLAVIRDGVVWLLPADLARAGVHGFGGTTRTFDGQQYVSLPSLAPGIASTFDERNLSLSLTAQPQYFAMTHLDLGGNAPPGMVYGKNTSGFFNYALDWQNFNQLSEFSELGVSAHGNLYYTGFSLAPGGRFIRGLTNATFDNPARLKRWVVGDTFADGGILGGSTFMGGISVSRNFSLNPYFVRYPGVGMGGQALTPSVAEIYVNGVLVGTRQLPPGRWDITNIPVVAGGGNTQVIVRDAFGHTQTLSSSYYYATTVLERGLSEYSYNLGAQRFNVGSSSSDYGPMRFVGFDRVGITNWFTAGARLDAGAGLISGGPSVALRLGRGQLGLNAAASHDAGLAGGAGELDYTYQNHILSFGGTLASVSPHYANASLSASANRVTALASAFAGFAIGPRASLTANYTTSNWRDTGIEHNVSFAAGWRFSNRLGLTAAANHFQSTGSTNQYTVSLNYQLGRSTLGAVSQQGGSSGSGAAVSVQQSLPLGTGVGYLFEHGGGSQIQNNDMLQVQTAYGLYQATYLQVNGFAQKDVLASGGLVDAGDGIMFTRAVEDGYAVIEVPGVRGVRGFFNNQQIGRTDAQGRLLVPNLLSYYGNRVEISDQDVPLDYSVDATEETVAPPYRGGALVRFPVKRQVAVTGVMVLDNVHPQRVPAFGQLRVQVGGHALVSELDAKGTFFLEDVMPGRYAGEVEYAEGSCLFDLVVPHELASVTQVGTVRCSPAQANTSGRAGAVAQ